MDIAPTTADAYRLLHDGSIAFAEIESNGMAVDIDYVDKTIREVKAQIEGLEQAQEVSEVVKTWRQVYRKSTNLDSGEQLGNVLFNHMRLPSIGKTENDKYKVDEEALEAIDHPFIKDYIRIKKLKRALGTNLRSIKRETVNGRVHPFFGLSVARSYRSNSNDFNYQNIPVRDPEIATMIRKAFRATDGDHQIIEVDFKGAEVIGAHAYHRDPVMETYLRDKTKDMHRDMASEIYKLPASEIIKPVRFAAKSYFVFAEFYGDWYKRCAKSLWDAAAAPDMLTASGVKLRRHLKRQGFTELGACDPEGDTVEGTFEHHMAAVERGFWHDRFSVYAQWKKDWYESYLEKGYVKMLSGFTCGGYMKKNEVINYPIQGFSFHCLLLALIRIMRIMRKRKMRSKVVGQIHDSVIGDIHKTERDEYLDICQKSIHPYIQKHWPSLIVPMEAEVEAADFGASWADKKPLKGS